MTEFMDDGAPPPFEESNDRTMPHNLEAEKCVLGAILIDNEQYRKIVDIIDGRDFYRDAHRRIWNKITILAAANTKIDLVTLKDELARSAELEEVGGPSYIAALTDGVPRAAHIEHYAKIVAETSASRRLIHASKKALTRAYEGGDQAAIAGELERELADIAAARTWETAMTPIQDVQQQAMDSLAVRMERADSKTPVGLPTGFDGIDDMTSGLQPTDLILVAGRPSMGKTSLAMNIVENICIADPTRIVAVFSLEMSKEQLYNRMLSSVSKVEAARIRSGRLTDMDMRSISQAMGALHDTKIWIDDSGTLTPHDVLGRARRLKLERGLHLIVIDYIQLMTGVGRFDSRQQEVSSISRALKSIAKELGVPVVALAQLSRANEQRKDKEPMLSDLRESGSLEQDSDVVMFIHRAEWYDRTDENAGKAKVIFGKQRNGPTGSIDLAFISEFSKFENTAERRMF